MDELSATSPCKAVLMAEINCFNYTMRWRNQPQYHGLLFSTAMTQAVCDPKCKSSLMAYITRVERICKDWKFDTGASLTLAPNYIYYGWNETCATDSKGNNCNGEYYLSGLRKRKHLLICGEDVIANFTIVDSLEAMPKNELCSECYTNRLFMMQRSPLSAYK